MPLGCNFLHLPGILYLLGGNMSEPVRKLTVSELIRESKPDWEHVRERERRASTGVFTGPATVQITVSHGSIAEQLEEFHEQNESGETDAVYGEATRFVDDLGQEAVVVGKVGSRVPR